MSKIGKRRLPIPENISYCRILIAINKEKLLSYEISKRTNINNAVINNHLQILLSENYIKYEFIKKRKFYFVNYIKIVDDFLNYLEKLRPNLKISKEYKTLKFKETYGEIFKFFFYEFYLKNVEVTLIDFFNDFKKLRMEDYYLLEEFVIDEVVKPNFITKENMKFIKLIRNFQEFIQRNYNYEISYFIEIFYNLYKKRMEKNRL